MMIIAFVLLTQILHLKLIYLGALNRKLQKLFKTKSKTLPPSLKLLITWPANQSVMGIQYYWIEA